MKEEIHQMFSATIEVYKGNKLFDKGCYALKFRESKKQIYCELDAMLFLDNQKTLSSIKPKEVIFKSHFTVEESGDFKTGYKFELIGYEDDKVGKGIVNSVMVQIS